MGQSMIEERRQTRKAGGWQARSIRGTMRRDA
jgi:hypothetical protein